jgi:hypothetical protein
MAAALVELTKPATVKVEKTAVFILDFLNNLIFRLKLLFPYETNTTIASC